MVVRIDRNNDGGDGGAERKKMVVAMVRRDKKNGGAGDGGADSRDAKKKVAVRVRHYAGRHLRKAWSLHRCLNASPKCVVDRC